MSVLFRLGDDSLYKKEEMMMTFLGGLAASDSTTQCATQGVVMFAPGRVTMARELIRSHSWHAQEGLSKESRHRAGVGEPVERGLLERGDRQEPGLKVVCDSLLSWCMDEIFPSALYIHNSRSAVRVSLREYDDSNDSVAVLGLCRQLMLTRSINRHDCASTRCLKPYIYAAHIAPKHRDFGTSEIGHDSLAS